MFRYYSILKEYNELLLDLSYTNFIFSLFLFFVFVLHFTTEPEHELFLVYGKGRPGVIRGMDMNAKVPDEYMIPIENLMNPRALDFHAGSEFIYFADATSYIIGRQKIDGTERDIILKEGTAKTRRSVTSVTLVYHCRETVLRLLCQSSSL